MRLISCHIDNFGKISNFDYDFSEDINIFCEENGWGKSTLAAFLRIMFFGLNKSRKNKSISEREKFSPWQGGTFGGHLDFIVHSHKYRLTRIFKDKEANDVFELRDLDTNLISSDFSSDIGEEIFKINSESFVRTVFVSQNDCETAANGNINAKIGNLTDNTGDIDSYEKACKIFKDYLNNNSDTRVTGSIAKKKAELSGIYADIIKEAGNDSLLTGAENRLLDLNNELAIQSGKRAELIKLVTKQSKLSDMKAFKKSYDELTQKIDSLEQNIREYEAFFNGAVPSVSDACMLRDDCNSYNLALLAYKAQNFDEKDADRLTKLESVYKDNFSLDSHKTVLYNANNLSAKRRELSSSGEAVFDYDRLDILKAAFANFDNPKEESEKLWNSFNRANKNIQEATVLKEKNNELKAEKSSLKKPPIFLIVGILLLVIAVIVFIAVNRYAGIGCTVPAVLLMAFQLTALNNKKKVQRIDDEIADNESALLALNDEHEMLLEEIKSDLTQAGIEFDDSNLSLGISRFSGFVSEYLNLLRSKPIVSAIEIKEKLDYQSGLIKDYIRKFGYEAIEADYEKVLDHISEEWEEYQNLSRWYQNHENLKNNYLIALTKVEDKLNLWEKCVDDNIMALSDRICDYARRFDEQSRELRLIKQNRAVLVESNNYNLEDIDINESDIIDVSTASEEIELINEKISALQNDIIQVSNSIQELSEKVADLSLMKESYIQLQKDIDEDLEKYELVKIASQLLVAAKEKLTSEYSDPILGYFTKYYQIIENGEEKFYMDANSNISFEEYGLQRDIALMSYGYRDLVGVCLRIALIDAMYPNESPVIFLDDPFVNLDDEKLKGAKLLLEEVSKKYQIIYFTCSQART